MNQRRIVDTQYRQRERWEDTPEAQAYERWVAGWERRKRVLLWATGVFALGIAAVLLAPLVVPQYAPEVVAVVGVYTVAVWLISWAWAIRQVRGRCDETK